MFVFFFFQAEDGIRDADVTGVQTCALPIWLVGTNVGLAAAHWRDRVRIIVYLKREPPTAEAQALVERVQAMSGVATVRYVSKTEALGTLKQVLGKDAS